VSKFEKTIVAKWILKEIKDSGFGWTILKQVELGWIQVGAVMARKKISHAFVICVAALRVGQSWFREAPNRILGLYQ
jgi:hypothetical protein